MARPTATISSLAICVWLTLWNLKRPRGDFKLQTTQNTWTHILPDQKLKLTTDRTATVLHGVVRMVSVAGFATVVATPAAKRDGTNNGASRCERHWTICAMKTKRILNQRARRCLPIRGPPAMRALHWYSILNTRANNFFFDMPAAGYLRTNRCARSPISNYSACCC